MEFDHRIDWDNVKILKSESHAYRRRVAESFLINQKACSCNAGVGKLFVLLGQIFIYPVACGPQYFPPMNAIDITIMRRVSVYYQAHIKTQYIDLFTIINVKDDVVSV